MNRWLGDRIELAQDICNGHPRGTYDDGALILCAAINCMASCVYPGRGIDRRRFVELVVNYGGRSRLTDWISIPVLHSRLVAKGIRDLEQRFESLCETRVLVDVDIDQSLADLSSGFPGLVASQSKLVRKCSYANLIYEQLRCGYAHEFRVGEVAHT